MWKLHIVAVAGEQAAFRDMVSPGARRLEGGAFLASGARLIHVGGARYDTAEAMLRRMSSHERAKLVRHRLIQMHRSGLGRAVAEYWTGEA